MAWSRARASVTVAQASIAVIMGTTIDPIADNIDALRVVATIVVGTAAKVGSAIQDSLAFGKRGTSGVRARRKFLNRGDGEGGEEEEDK